MRISQCPPSWRSRAYHLRRGWPEPAEQDRYYVSRNISYGVITTLSSDKHTIPVGEKPIFLLDGVRVGRERQVLAGKGTNQDQQARFRQMKIGEHRSRPPEFCSRIQKQTGHRRRGIAFNRAHTSGADGDHPSRPIHGLNSRWRDHERLLMQCNIFNNIAMQRLKCSEAHMQCHASNLRPALPQNFRRKVQPGGRSSH